MRLRLASLADGVSVPIPLPFRWESPSQVRGLAAVANPAGDPSAMSILAPTLLTPKD